MASVFPVLQAMAVKQFFMWLSCFIKNKLWPFETINWLFKQQILWDWAILVSYKKMKNLLAHFKPDDQIWWSNDDQPDIL